MPTPGTLPRHAEALKLALFMVNAPAAAGNRGTLEFFQLRP